MNGVVEIAGPAQFRLDELISTACALALRTIRARWSPTASPYFGAQPGERALFPAADAQLGTIRFEDWLSRT